MYRAAPRSREIEVAEQMRDRTVPEDAGRYLRAHGILCELREKYRKRKITAQQYRTIRGQAIAGDVDGAVKGLGKLLEENCDGGKAI